MLLMSLSCSLALVVYAKWGLNFPGEEEREVVEEGGEGVERRLRLGGEGG